MKSLPNPPRFAAVLEGAWLNAEDDAKAAHIRKEIATYWRSSEFAPLQRSAQACWNALWTADPASSDAKGAAYQWSRYIAHVWARRGIVVGDDRLRARLVEVRMS
jgi:hypothetical protein